MVDLSDFHIEFLVDLLRAKENETESLLEEIGRGYSSPFLKDILTDTKHTCEELSRLLVDSQRGKL